MASAIGLVVVFVTIMYACLRLYCKVRRIGIILIKVA